MNVRPMRGQRMSWLALLAILLLTAALAIGAAACSDDSDSNPTAANSIATAVPSSTGSTSATANASKVALSGDITVFAASSLTDAFNAAGKQFETDNPGTKVTFNFAASSALATQINEGAPADVFASADGAQMRAVSDKGTTEPQAIFATNVPVVVVPKDDTTVQSFEDLAKSGVKLVLAAPEVPIGNYARQILTNASGDGGIDPGFSDSVLKNLVSNEANVRAVLAKIQVGEADAGIVYTTDAATAKDDVKIIDIPEKYNVIAQYPVAAIKASKHLDVAAAFVSFLTSDDGQAILKRFGFGKAP